jgi:Animal haem peroxidase
MGVFVSLATAIDRTIGWDRLPRSLGLLTLIGVRNRLRADNLHDTGLVKQAPPAPSDQNVRTVDGSYNDLGKPVMGSVGTRFGRNIKRDRTFPDPEPMNPNPRLVSRELLTREQFIPAPTLNVLAAAWIQFEVHDWFSHHFEEQSPFEIPIADDDEWPERPMRIKRTETDPSAAGDGSPPTFITHDSHWWDGSQIYGSDPAFAAALRTPDGKLVLDKKGLPPAKLLEIAIGLSPTAVNFWVGLGLLHTLFMREHNAIVDHLVAQERGRSWTPDELYDTARLINAAVTAKIHTVEWTPAIIAHPTTEAGMRANWYGLLGERFPSLRRFGPARRSDVLTGIPGSPTDHHTAPYSLTEEFVAVYRMHPLIPDDYVFRSVEDDRELGRFELPDLDAWQTHGRLAKFGMPNLLYSFGIAHPGAITLHNYPRHLQQLTRTVGDVVENIDLAATDILRMRERGVPRYNEFRRLFHRRPVKSFEDVNPNPVVADELRRVYGDVDKLDLMIGLYAEPPPHGFAFSDTTFRVFILMASRRLKSDRFFTSDYTPEVYTQAGLDWIEDATMSKVLLRHYPELAPALWGVDNAFKPWTRVR